MIAAALITLREVIEASLIVATVLGILVRLGRPEAKRTVWLATVSACAASVLLLVTGSLMGVAVKNAYSGNIEEMTEGILMAVSALFITWAVFFLHSYFGRYKTRLLVDIRKTAGGDEVGALFWLTFTAVFREGIEIVLFLSTVFLSDDPGRILLGFSIGVTGGLAIAWGLFAATLRLPVYLAFRVTSALLIFFAAGLFARGIHEFAEVGIIPELSRITLAFLPPAQTLFGQLIHAVFGISRSMDPLQIAVYCMYAAFMFWRVFAGDTRSARPVAPDDKN